jgi:Domain of unknown function (DUF4430)
MRRLGAKAIMLALLALVVAIVFSGCSIGPEAKGSGAALTVTRDFGAVPITRTHEGKLPGGETAMRLLQRKAKVETRYGGRFVNAIDGVRSSTENGRRRDWFYYVNGIEAGVSAAEQRLHSGDSVWWDYRDWTGAMRVPAVVGEFPEPFAHGAEGKRYPIRIDCADGAEATCHDVADALERADIDASTTAIGAVTGKDVLRLVVGDWQSVRADAAARQIEEGPQKSGVFARFGPGSQGPELLLLDRFGRVVQRLAAGGGLVAATRFEEQQPTWVVTGVDEKGVQRATRLLSARLLRNHYAVASDDGKPISLPVTGAEESAGQSTGAKEGS